MVERLPSLKSLEVFVQAGKCLSFSQTALTLGMSASAVSRRIGALEQDLGLALFIRHGKSVSLTAAGAQYLDDLAPRSPRFAARPTPFRNPAEGWSSPPPSPLPSAG